MRRFVLEYQGARPGLFSAMTTMTLRRPTWRRTHHPVVTRDRLGGWHWSCGCGAGSWSAGVWRESVLAAIRHESLSPGE